MSVKLYLILCLNIIHMASSGHRKGITPAFDHDLYERVLDTEQCELQLKLLVNTTLLLYFIDASAKLPSGILSGNLHDLGDYHQCLGIHQAVEGTEIHGKYCAITIPVQQYTLQLPDRVWPRVGNETDEEVERIRQHALVLSGLGDTGSTRKAKGLTRSMEMFLGVCIPKVCKTSEAVNFVLEPLKWLNLSYSESYCRLPRDKPFAVADYVAIIVFSALGCLMIASTSYDLYCVFVLQRELSQVSTVYRSFSLYTNTRRFLTFSSAPGALECVDGIRAISMMWVVVGHTYATTLFGFVHNMADVAKWQHKFSSTWMNSAPIVVDTFFMLSGILAVYTTLGKVSRGQFLKGLHLFYLHRLLRMFPLLATVVLLQASLFNYVSDGPYWLYMAVFTENCRKYWLSTLLHVQNYINPDEICLPHSWYLSVDVQLYVASPLVLVATFGRRRVAWLALTTALCLALISSTYHSFTYNFSAALSYPDPAQFQQYMKVYYYNTLCRAPPFFVGMLYGYLLHLHRNKNIQFTKTNLTVLWAMSFALLAFCILSMYPVMQAEHSAQLFDNLLNAYMRAMWALGLGWLVFACVHGYGGPINWFLSLRVWKLPARLSYAMYLIHFPIMVAAAGSWTEPYYFTDARNLYRFMGDMAFAFGSALILSIAVDAPCSTLQKLLLGGNVCSHLQKRNSESPENNDEGCSHIKTTL